MRPFFPGSEHPYKNTTPLVQEDLIPHACDLIFRASVKEIHTIEVKLLSGTKENLPRRLYMLL